MPVTAQQIRVQQVALHVHIVRRDRGEAREHLRRLGMALQLHQGGAQVVERFGRARVDRQRLLVAGKRIERPALFLQAQAAVVPGGRKTGLQADRRIEGLDGGAVLALRVQGGTEVVQRIGIGRRDGERLPVACNRIRGPL